MSKLVFAVTNIMLTPGELSIYQALGAGLAKLRRTSNHADTRTIPELAHSMGQAIVWIAPQKLGRSSSRKLKGYLFRVGLCSSPLKGPVWKGRVTFVD